MESIGSYKSDIDEADNFDATELRLGLPGSEPSTKTARISAKRALESTSTTRSTGSTEESTCEDTRPPTKAQVVGWPPVQSFRRNTFHARKAGEDADGAAGCGNCGGLMVKVSMDGAPYLRKIDLMMYKGYKELRMALDIMFISFSIGENTVTYEDKDGDWMLVGDVPWEMFTSSCKKLRIMRSS